jgi:hypothetical protein
MGIKVAKEVPTRKRERKEDLVLGPDTLEAERRQANERETKDRT